MFKKELGRRDGEAGAGFSRQSAKNNKKKKGKVKK
jgi:hypothetical protein